MTNVAPLPAFADADSFSAFRSDPPRWLPIALDIARSHGLDTSAPHVFVTGTNLVVGLSEKLILKIFPPQLGAQFVSERGSLAQLAGRLSLPIPEIVAEGERDGWPYLVITRLAGTLGSEVWPQLAEDQKERLLRQIGETIAAVQHAPLGPLANMNRAGTTSCAPRCRAVRRGTRASALHRNSSKASTISCATRPS